MAPAEEGRAARDSGMLHLARLTTARAGDVPPIYRVAIAVMAGDAMGNLRFHLPLWFVIAAALVAAVLFVASRPAWAVAISIAGIAGASTIPAYHLLEPASDPASIRAFPDGTLITIEGRLIREAERYRDRTHLFVAAQRAGPPAAPLRPAGGVVRVTVLDRFPARVGDDVRVIGPIRFPCNYGDPAEFDYEAFQAREGVTATMVVKRSRSPDDSSIQVVGRHPQFWFSTVEAIRERIGAFIDSNLAYPERELVRALIIGERGGIDDRMRDTFALTGMAHLLIISGLHLSFVAAAAFGAARFILAFFPILMIRGYANKLAAIAAAIAVAAYASIAGHHVSTIRALVMVLAYVLAVVIDRAREVLASLALAAIVICLAIPGSTADIGFQLSFVSVLAIVLGMRRFTAWWQRRVPAGSDARASWRYRAAEVVLGYIAVSFWALIGTAPLTAYHFNQFAIVGLVANAVVIPIMGAAGTVVGLSAVALSFIWAAPARAMLWVAGQLLVAGTRLAGWFVTWPMAWTRTFTPTPLELAITYALLLLWLYWPIAGSPGAHRVGAGSEKVPLRPSNLGRLAVLGVLIAGLSLDALWWIRQRYFNPDLRVTFLSVGEGDCAVVRFPGSRVMVIDGGGSSGEFDPGERILAPYLWSQKIARVDYLVLSHPELDHFGGLAFVARNFRPQEFWTISAPSPDLKYADLLGMLADAGTRLRIVDSSFVPPQIGGTDLRCLGPPPDQVASRNNSSMVIRLRFGPSSILFTGDLEAIGEHSLIAHTEDLRSTILKAPHHGSATSSTESLVERVHPSAVVISVGYRNRFGFPAVEVVDRYRAIGATVLRTDQDGAVEVDASPTGMKLGTYSQRAAAE
jgi:competence protein ComEC